MRNIKLTIEYDGTHFKGWQIQNKKSRTVQSEIEKALSKISKKKVKIIGSGRTDSGVHAIGQVANGKIDSSLSTEQLLKALNANLPKDVCILKVKEVKESFHAQYSVKSKTYRYAILNRTARCAQCHQYVLHYPSPLNLRDMRREAKSFLGRKDFKSFQGAYPPHSRNDHKSSIRNIKRVDITKKNDFILIEIEANGFLYKMVRNIVGTLIAVGKGKLEKGSIQKILKKKDRKFAAATAKAKGLSLVEVIY